jgi:hypothetical protein
MKSVAIAKTLSVLVLSSVVVAASLDVKANATVLTFDDIDTDNLGAVSNGYGGLTWNNMNYIKNTHIPTAGYGIGTISGSYTAFNGFGAPAYVSSSSTFNFKSAYLTSGWMNDLSVTVEGFLGGVQKYSQTVAVNTAAPQLFNFNFATVDQLKFSSFSPTNSTLRQFAMDNFTFTDNDPLTQVPEPATILGTLAFGTLGGRTFWKKRKSSKSA